MKKHLTLEEISRLTPEEAKEYCGEIRDFLVESVSETGGHLASNLGIVEISVALARVMDFSHDSVVYDTGHQAYVHKILTGRGEAFSSLRSFGGISGFPRREESEYDAFGTGHSGTGISAALGLSRARRLRGEDGWSVAVIGDGSFTGGMVFEALNNVSPDEKLIIILNDNGMSISKSVGRIKSQLNRMRTAEYYRIKGEVRGTLDRIPVLGEAFAHVAKSVKNSVKRSALPMGNLFEQFGLHYFGPADGNDINVVEFLLREAKKRGKPALLHLCTKKGKGYEPAEKDPARYHGISGKNEKKSTEKTSSALFGENLLELAQEDERIACITAAMGDGVGLFEFARRYPTRFFDVGIAEEHAMTFAAALSAGGIKPCFAVYSTFYQRAVDQILHDAALQKLPVTVALDRAGLSGEDGATHHGVFDLPLTLPIPGVRIYSPLGKEEMKRHLKKAFAETECPSVIRYAKGPFSPLVAEHFPLREEIETVVFGQGKPKLCVVTFGRVTENVLVASRAAAERGMTLSVVRFAQLKGFDLAKAKEILEPFSHLLFVEEGMKIGGFSSYLIECLGESLTSKKKILAIGEEFVPHGKTSLLFCELGLSAEQIGKEIEEFVKT